MIEKPTLAWQAQNVEYSDTSGVSYAGPSRPKDNPLSPGVSWGSTPDEVKKGLAPPPKRSDFDSEESFEDANGVWAYYVLPELSMRVSRLKVSPNPK